MQLIAHIGITLGSAWVLQQAFRGIKRNVSESKLNYVASGSLSDHTIEAGSKPVAAAGWLDYRFLLLGSIFPDIVDKPLGVIFQVSGRAFCHTLLFMALILAAGICLFRIRKNPGLFCFALGCVTHVLLDSVWLNKITFLWPLFGWGFQHTDISIGPWIESLFLDLITKPSEYIPEVIGAILLALFFFGLSRNGKISRPIKSRLSLIFQSLFSGLKQKNAYQQDILSRAKQGSFEAKAYNDVAFCEWDAYKYQADLGDQIGFGHGSWWDVWDWFDNQGFAQSLNVNSNYNDYIAWCSIYYITLGGGYDLPYNPTLTADDYKNR